MYTILVIDDDQALCEVIRKILAREGHKVLFTHTAAEGFEACLVNKPDLVLLDVHLPDGNGIDVCRKLKANQELRHIPVIILTGEAIEAGSRVEGLEAGADDYILKPFDAEELLLRVKSIIVQVYEPDSRLRENKGPL